MAAGDLIDLGDFLDRDPILTSIIPGGIIHLDIARLDPALYILDLVRTDLGTIEHKVKFHDHG
jgi:hypothetical protein